MAFSTPTFLFLFLPVVLALHALAGRRARNVVLLAASLLFYAWGEREVVLVMVASIAANWVLARALARSQDQGRRKLLLALAVAVDLGLLVAFKYADFLVANLNVALAAMGLDELTPPGIQLPIGISFYTFQAMSYVIDVYRGNARDQRNPLHFATYIALFPQLVAGPIVRYRDIAQQLLTRVISLPLFASGVARFIVGLAKKSLVADPLSLTADGLFATAPHDLTAGMAWLGLLAYTLQIYFDFSGYSDMAIGLGRMLGFRFLENFEHPYVARSITEFWRRWHISLSTWFRDYLYIPLGGNRTGRTGRNLLLVFLLCGLWHGASWLFVAWGLWHGLFLVVERAGAGRWLRRMPAALRHLYTLAIVMGGWVLFRAPDPTAALGYAGALVGAGTADGIAHHAGLLLDPRLVLTLIAGALGATPWVALLHARMTRPTVSRPWALVYGGARLGCLLALYALSAASLLASTNHPFIYFRF